MRKSLLASSLLVLLALTVSCTSDESKVQEASLAGAKARFQHEISEEIAKGVVGKNNLQVTAAKMITEKSEFEVQKVELQGNSAVAVVQVLAVPLKARVALIEIMAKIEDKKERSFNVPDALTMIYQQLNLSETKSLQVYKLRLEKSDDWHVLTDDKK